MSLSKSMKNLKRRLTKMKLTVLCGLNEDSMVVNLNIPVKITGNLGAGDKFSIKMNDLDADQVKMVMRKLKLSDSWFTGSDSLLP